MLRVAHDPRERVSPKLGEFFEHIAFGGAVHGPPLPLPVFIVAHGYRPGPHAIAPPEHRPLAATTPASHWDLPLLGLFDPGQSTLRSPH